MLAGRKYLTMEKWESNVAIAHAHGLGEQKRCPVQQGNNVLSTGQNPHELHTSV